MLNPRLHGKNYFQDSMDSFGGSIVVVPLTDNDGKNAVYYPGTRCFLISVSCNFALRPRPSKRYHFLSNLKTLIDVHYALQTSNSLRTTI